METSYTSEERISADEDTAVVVKAPSPSEAVTVTVPENRDDPSGTTRSVAVSFPELTGLPAELKLLSDEDLIARYWTTLIVDDKTAAEFAAVTEEVRSRGRGLVPFLD